MAFSPNKDQRFYLIPKHSHKKDPDEDMCLGVEDDNPGRPLQLQNISSSAHKIPLQQFSFEARGATYYINMPGMENRFLNVAQGSIANANPIVSFQKEDVDHAQFRLLYAGGGYYRIGCYHSGKVFDVWEARTEPGSPVVQFQLSGTDNQLFKLVAAPDQPIAKDATSFIQANETARTLALAIIAKVPDYGGGLVFVIGTFWKAQDKFAALWEQMKSYVDARLEAYFKKAKLDELATTLQGEMDELGGIAGSKIIPEIRLVTALDSMVGARASFINKMEETLPYFVALQTVIIGVRHTLYHDFDSLFPGNPAGKKEAKENLIKDINDFTKYITCKKADILVSRLAKITATLLTGQEEMVQGAKRTLVIFDQYDGWKKTVGEEDVESTIKRRKDLVEIQFSAQLDELLYTFRFWKYLIPDAPFYTPEKKNLSVSFYGNGSEKTDFDRGYGRITRIDLGCYNPYGSFDAYLGGIEVFYDGVSQGMHGGERGSKYPIIKSITLAEDEWICSVYGSESLNALIITTTKGQILKTDKFFGPAQDLLSCFCADLPDSMNAKLAGISGKSVREGLGELTFHWDYVL